MANANHSISPRQSITVGLASLHFLSSIKASDAASYEVEFQTVDIFKYAAHLRAKRGTEIDETARPNTLLDDVRDCDLCDTVKDRIAFAGGLQ